MAPAPLQHQHKHQSTRAAERREADRVRKREARAKAKAEGVPDPGLVDYAVADAVSFCIANADKRVWLASQGWTPINASAIWIIALDVLVHRFHKNPEKSAAALRARMGKQERHTVTGAIPSTDPAPGHPKYNLQAPADKSGQKRSAPPLPLQDLSRQVRKQATQIR